MRFLLDTYDQELDRILGELLDETTVEAYGDARHAAEVLAMELGIWDGDVLEVDEEGYVVLRTPPAVIARNLRVAHEAKEAGRPMVELIREGAFRTEPLPDTWAQAHAPAPKPRVWNLLLRSPDGRPVAVTWDQERGTVTGPGAGEVLALLMEADRVGGVSGSCGLRIVIDPFHHPRDFAGVLLAHGYALPPELAVRASEPANTPP